MHNFLVVKHGLHVRIKCCGARVYVLLEGPFNLREVYELHAAFAQLDGELVGEVLGLEEHDRELLTLDGAERLFTVAPVLNHVVAVEGLVLGKGTATHVLLAVGLGVVVHLGVYLVGVTHYVLVVYGSLVPRRGALLAIGRGGRDLGG